MAIEPDMPDPDWERYRVASGGDVPPVGDPTRWGATSLTNPPVGQVAYTPPLIALGTRDPYSRSWSLLGSLGMVLAAWDNVCFVDLECTMGVGQIQIVQWISLLNGDWRNGLCETQALFSMGYNTGAYARGTGPFREQRDPITNNVVRSFAAVGALVGQSITVRARIQVDRATPVQIGLIVTPYAAGEGL